MFSIEIARPSNLNKTINIINYYSTQSHFTMRHRFKSTVLGRFLIRFGSNREVRNQYRALTSHTAPSRAGSILEICVYVAPCAQARTAYALDLSNVPPPNRPTAPAVLPAYNSPLSSPRYGAITEKIAAPGAYSSRWKRLARSITRGLIASAAVRSVSACAAWPAWRSAKLRA